MSVPPSIVTWLSSYRTTNQVAVAGDRVDEVVARAVVAGVETRLRHIGRQRHADGVAEALAERSGGDLDAGRLAVLGMSRRRRAELPEVLNLLEAEIESVEMHQRVEQHRGVPGGKHEAIAQRPGRVRRIETQVAIPELEHRPGQAHGRAQVTDSGSFDGIHRQPANRVLDLLAKCGRELGGHPSLQRGRRGGGRLAWGAQPRGR
jgi:hypothetical protein